MKTNENSLIEMLGSMLFGLGFKKLRLNWYRELELLVFVVNIQRSQYGPAMYINVGFSRKATGESVRPPVYRCEATGRIEALLGRKSRLQSILERPEIAPWSRDELAILRDELERACAIIDAWKDDGVLKRYFLKHQKIEWLVDEELWQWIKGIQHGHS